MVWLPDGEKFEDIYSVSQKLEPFSFDHNFRKYCWILIILSLLHTEIICHKHVIEFSTSPLVMDARSA